MTSGWVEKTSVQSFINDGWVDSGRRVIEGGTVFHWLTMDDSMTPLKSILAERGTNYGDFTTESELAIAVKNLMRANPGWGQLSPAHQNALDLIVLKMSRIVNGRGNYKDSWVDIQGYGKLGEDRCATD